MIIGIISIVFIFKRFCRGKTFTKNFRNLFVIRHFLYVTTYLVVLGPLKIFILLDCLKIERGKSPVSFNFCLYCNICIGMIMFFIRSLETNFYKMILCSFCRKKEGNSEQMYFIDKPLTSIISRNMNLEFMCCILYGLSDIFKKDEARKRKGFATFDMGDECTLNIDDRSNNLSNLRFDKQCSKEKSLLGVGIKKYFTLFENL